MIQAGLSAREWDRPGPVIPGFLTPCVSWLYSVLPGWSLLLGPAGLYLPTFEEQMSKALIDSAVSAGHEVETDDAALLAAQTADAAAKTALTKAAQDLHDDLAANGPEVVIDASGTAPVVTLYQSVDPGSYSATVVRVAS